MVLALAATRGPYWSANYPASNTFTTSSFTPTANSLLVVVAQSQPDTPTPGGSYEADTVVSGGGLEWTKRSGVQVPTGGSGAWAQSCQIWTAEVGASPSSMTITVTSPGGAATHKIGVTCHEFTDYDTEEPIGGVASGYGSTSLASITLSSAPAASSFVLGSLYIGGVPGAITPGSGCTEITDDINEWFRFQTQHRTGSTSTTVEWGTTSTGSEIGIGAVAVEVKAAPEPPDGFADVSVTGSDRTSASNTTSHAVTIPSGDVGDLLVVALAVDGAPTISINTGASGAGWSRAGQASNSTTVTGDVFWKVAEGSDALTLTTSASEQSSHVVYRIKEFGAGVETSNANGSSTNSNPPSLTPSWGSAETLWLVARMGDSTVQPTVAPTDFGGLVSIAAAGTGGASAAMAWRKYEGSTLDPGTFTSTSEQWVSFTIAIQPASGDVGISIDASFTEANEILSAEATVGVLLDASITEPGETLASEIVLGVALTASIAEPVETLDAVVAAALSIEAAFTEANESLSAAIQSPTTISAIITEPNEALGAAMTLPIDVSAALTEESEQVTIEAALTVSMAADLAEPNESLEAEVITVGQGISASFVEPNETLQSAIGIGLSMDVDVEEGDSLDASAAVTIGIAADLSEANETLSAAILANGEGISLVAVEPNETLSSQIAVGLDLVADMAEPAETLVSGVGARISIEASAAEANETLDAAIGLIPLGLTIDLDAIEDGEVVVSLMRLAIGVSVDAVEESESISIGFGAINPGVITAMVGPRIGITAEVSAGGTTLSVKSKSISTVGVGPRITISED